MIGVDRRSDLTNGGYEGYNMRITQRQVAIGMQTLLLAGTLAILIFQIITGDDLIAIITTIAGLAVGGTVLFL